jgi:hypothetical protein
MTNKKQCNRHHSKYHSSHVLPPTVPPTVFQLQTYPADSPFPSSSTPTQLPVPFTTDTVPMAVQLFQITSPSNNPTQRVPILSREESHRYFTHNQTDHLGPASLVSLAHYKNRMHTHQIPPQEVYTHILIAQHASFLSKGQKKNFAHLLRNLLKNKQSVPFLNDKFSQPVIPPIPTTFAQIRTIYSEGRHSIMQNLPYPAIQTNVPHHCYVKISDVIEDFLAHGFLPLQPSLHQSTAWISEMSQSPQLVSSLQSANAKFGNIPFFFIGFKEWQDDYESQYAKKDRGSVWCKNITILAEQGTPRHLCTYPIAFSSKGVDHQPVEKQLEKDMLRFMGNGENLFYSSRLGRQIRVHACLYVSLADQLERRPVTRTSSGNHTYHARFGYSIRFKSLLHRLPSCTACRISIREKIASIYTGSYISDYISAYQPPECQVCLSWLQDPSLRQDVSYPAPADYPSSELDDSRQLFPFRLTFEKLIDASLKAIENIRSGAWTAKQGEAYLDVHCIIKDTKQDIIERASIQRQLSVNHGLSAEERDALRQKVDNQLLLDPTFLDDWQPPAIWNRNATLAQHLDAPMHLIFHGIVKGMCPMTLEWLTNRRSLAGFNRYYGKGLLDPICGFSLDWCKLIEFNGSFAGWLAENYVGLTKISLWFWSGILNVSEDPAYVPPNTPFHRWNGNECKEWLKNHGIKDTSKITAAQAKQDVAEMMTRNEGPPVMPNVTGGTIDIIVSLYLSLDRLVRVLMAPAYPVGSKDTVTLHVLDFLNCFETFRPVRVGREMPEWLTMYNFLCLLNLPDAIDNLGPLRFNYEGNSEGEGFIPMVKPLLSQGMRKNWQNNLAHRFFRNRSMKLVSRDARLFIGDEGTCDYQESTPYRKKMFHKYRSWQQVQSDFMKGLPLSLVLLRNGFLGAVVKDSEAFVFVPVRLLNFISCRFGLNYFSAQLFERNGAGEITRNTINVGKVADFAAFVLLLPRLEPTYYVLSVDVTWTMVGSEYERLSEDGSLHGVFQLPLHLHNPNQYNIVFNNGAVEEGDSEDDISFAGGLQ